MSTQGMRKAPLKGYRRRKGVLGMDLNVPPAENRGQEGTSTNSGGTLEVHVDQESHFVPPATIDIEALDDDVVISSSSAFAEAKNNSRRNRGVTVVVDLDSDMMTGLPNSNRRRRRRISSNQPVINCDLINLETVRENVTKPSPPPPPKPIFSCPICMGTLTEEMSTKCGHIFCKTCIKTAISVQAKCPTCRKKVTVKELIRVFLPSSSI